jgi:hypothetical protein
MSSIVISGDTSGAITLAAPAVSGTNTATLPASTGTIMVSGNMPAFSAYANANQSISALTNTKVIFQVEDFDTASAFDNTTNYRFTPQVAGYYQINANINFQNIATYVYIMLAKNGTVIKTLAYAASSSAFFTTLAGSCLVQMNGTTDYLEIYAYCGINLSLVPNNVSSGNTGVNFNGALVRAA